MVDADGAAASFPIAAILVSAGTMDADSDGNVFDDISTGTHQGDNRDGNPNYIRHPSVDDFDDLVVYLGENELYGKICEYLALAVNNTSGATVYVYNSTQGADLGTLNDGSSGVYEIMSRTQIEIRNASGGMARPAHAYTRGQASITYLPQVDYCILQVCRVCTHQRAFPLAVNLGCYSY